MPGLPWMVDCCSSTRWGASARPRFAFLFQFACSSPTAQGSGGALFMNSAGTISTSAAVPQGAYFKGWPRRACFCFVFVLLQRLRAAPGAPAGPSAALKFVVRQICCAQKKTAQESCKWLKNTLPRKKIYYLVL